MKTFIYLLFLALCIAVILATIILIAWKIQQEQMQFRHVKMFVKVLSGLNKGDWKTYNEDRKRGVYKLITGDQKILVFDDGERIPFPKDSVFIWAEESEGIENEN